MTEELKTWISDHLYEALSGLYESVRRIVEASGGQRNYLWNFQLRLQQIASLPHSQIEEDYLKFLRRIESKGHGEAWLGEQLRNLIYTELQRRVEQEGGVLSSSLISKETIKIPEGSVFLHQSLIEYARYVYEHPELFSHRLKPLDSAQNERVARQQSREALKKTIKKYCAPEYIFRGRGEHPPGTGASESLAAAVKVEPIDEKLPPIETEKSKSIRASLRKVLGDSESDDGEGEGEGDGEGDDKILPLTRQNVDLVNQSYAASSRRPRPDVATLGTMTAISTISTAHMSVRQSTHGHGSTRRSTHGHGSTRRSTRRSTRETERDSSRRKALDQLSEMERRDDVASSRYSDRRIEDVVIHGSAATKYQSKELDKKFEKSWSPPEANLTAEEIMQIPKGKLDVSLKEIHPLDEVPVKDLPREWKGSQRGGSGRRSVRHSARRSDRRSGRRTSDQESTMRREVKRYLAKLG